MPDLANQEWPVKTHFSRLKCSWLTSSWLETRPAANLCSEDCVPRERKRETSMRGRERERESEREIERQTKRDRGRERERERERDRESE